MTSASPRPKPIPGRHVALAFFILLVTFAVTHLLSFPGSIAHFREATGGQKILDMRASSSAAETYERLSAMGEIGRALYLRLVVTIDIVFPLAMLAFLLMFAWFAAHREGLPVWAARLLALPPLLYFGLDLLENASVLAMLLQYPDRLDGVAWIVGHLTRGKRASMIVALLAPVVLIVGSRAMSYLAERRVAPSDPSGAGSSP